MARGGSGAKFYSVAHGRAVGIYDSWAACHAQVDRFPNAVFKSFSTREAAQQFLNLRRPEPEVRQEERRPPQPAPLRRFEVAPPPVAPPPVAPPPVRTVELAPPPRPTRVYVDGSCLANGRGSSARGGYGGFYGHNDPRNFSEALLPNERQTNNRAELKAVIRVLEDACTMRMQGPLHIYTDSKYCIEGITQWIHNWARKDFKGVENVDLWKVLDHVLKQRRREYSDDGCGTPAAAVVFTHVKGHSGDPGNDAADRLAVLGSLRTQQREQAERKRPRED